jgi:hypothetical protein
MVGDRSSQCDRAIDNVYDYLEGKSHLLSLKLMKSITTV